MGTTKQTIRDEYWRAIEQCDRNYDDTFFYGVKTTGIFCRPSCKSRIPNKGNVRIFKNAYVAVEEHFRPCKRCRPDGLKLPAEEWIGQISSWIDTHYAEPITLQSLADEWHGSPYYLQRLFKRTTGLSPTEYVQKVRLKNARYLLQSTDQMVADISLEVGFSSTPYFITLFKRTTGCTPSQFRKQQKAGEFS
ncbi:bifunctional transcriptional activator/DNA repair enzyme AdaA [Domibacillus iocasae]|uniref:AraC family transcriptional regulator n=1 Tax=Domibacillus iocasae TaxID=1714016 RepID=A0A1E7DL90_9BACI|nr:bifunctional transcriptional activator/DNA repair enzyme AdaA [Domibacillus iocasae]OES43438.1 AraC family transcriptional regulator [Domibacillus iocasae]